MRGQREDVVAGVLADLVRDEDPVGRVLVVDDRPGAVEAAFAERGDEPVPWLRFAVRGRPPARPWPPDGPFDSASVRLPKGREALRMLLHASLSRLRPGASLWLYGANDEGVRSAGKTLATVADGARSVETKRHCRVWRAERPEAGREEGFEPLRGELDDWRSEFAVRLPAGDPVTLCSYPGVFAHGRLDPGTALLAEALPAFGAGARVLDFGCGAGALALAVRAACPTAELHLLDHDALAADAARRNVPGAHVHLADGLAGLPPELRFDAIVSNPPFHQGRDRDVEVARRLAEESGRRLRPGGQLILVAERTLPVQRWIGSGLSGAKVLRERGGYRVWSAEARSRPGTFHSPLPSGRT